MKRIILLLLLLVCITSRLKAQLLIKDSSLNTFMFGAAIMGEIPGGDLAKRFGPGITVGGFVSYKTATNWLFSLDYAYMYSGTVKENGALDSISTKSSGQLINGDGEYQTLSLNESGNLVFLKVGRMFRLLQHNANSGLTAKIGAGFMEHKIKYYWTGQDPLQLQGNYIYGYDRLTYGPAFMQSIGYHYMGNNGRINFMIDFEINEGITYNRRAYDFDLMKWDNKQRLDIVYGLKFGWFFPIYGRHNRRAQINYY